MSTIIAYVPKPNKRFNVKRLKFGAKKKGTERGRKNIPVRGREIKGDEEKNCMISQAKSTKNMLIYGVGVSMRCDKNSTQNTENPNLLSSTENPYRKRKGREYGIIQNSYTRARVHQH